MVEWFREHLSRVTDEDDAVPNDERIDQQAESMSAQLRQGLADIVGTWSAEAPDSKYDQLLAALRELRDAEPSAKSMIFAFFKRTLRYVQRRLIADGFLVWLIDGDVPADLRKGLIDEFRDHEGFGVLLSSRVGSEGLDFQFCSTMFDYDFRGIPWRSSSV